MLNHWHAVYAEIYGDWRFCPPLADANGEMGNGWARKEPPEIRRLLGESFFFYAAMSAYSKNMWPMALQTTPVMPGLTR